MASIKKNELKAMDVVKLNARMDELRKDLMKMRAQVAIGTNVESPGRIRATRRNIAKILTILRDKTQENKSSRGTKEPRSLSESKEILTKKKEAVKK